MLKFKRYIIPVSTGMVVILVFLLFPKFFHQQELNDKLFFATRLILLLYLFLSMDLYFKEVLNYRAEFQKLFFRGTILSLIFTIFTSAGLFILYFQDPQNNVEGFSIFKSWYLQVSKFLKVGLLYTIACIIYFRFHPNNLLKKEKK